MKTNSNLKYLEAKRQVKRMKGFYIHLAIFIIVNLLGAVDAMADGENIFQDRNWIGLGLWTIGLTMHGLSVFMPGFICGKDWEEKKIREILDRN